MTKSALHFPVDRPLTKKLVKRLIAVRLAEAGRGDTRSPARVFRNDA
jgi:hypothetical protein